MQELPTLPIHKANMEWQYFRAMFCKSTVLSNIYKRRSIQMSMTVATVNISGPGQVSEPELAAGTGGVDERVGDAVALEAPDEEEPRSDEAG